MLVLGALLFVVLTFAAALIAGFGTFAAIVIAAVMIVAIYLFHHSTASTGIRP